jgi:hypothetical protein
MLDIFSDCGIFPPRGKELSLQGGTKPPPWGGELSLKGWNDLSQGKGDSPLEVGSEIVLSPGGERLSRLGVECVDRWIGWPFERDRGVNYVTRWEDLNEPSQERELFSRMTW